MTTFKRICAVVLSMAMLLCTISTTAFAAEVPANTSDITSIDQTQVNAMRFEDVTVDELRNLDSDAVIAVENYVGIDELGRYYVVNEQSLRATLSNEEYALVLEQIEDSNIANSIMLAATEDGTESNPYILTADTPLGTNASSASSTWFRINSIRGAVDFKITTSTSASATFYKKTLLGKTQIGSASGSSIKRTISNSGTNNNSNNYIINVAVSSAMTSSITVGQHTDETTTYYTRGTIWTPNNMSAIPNTNLLTMKMWYLKAEDVDKLVSFVNHDQYLQFCDDFAAGLITAAGIATTIWGSGAYAKVVGVALSLIGLETSSLFKQHVLNSIDEVGGWNGYSFTNDIYMKQVFTSDALYFTYVYEWDGGTIYGAPGYTGTFSAAPAE